MLKGRELSNNPSLITVSLGDIPIYKSYIDIEPYVIKDKYCTLDFDDLMNKNQFKDYPFCWIVENLSDEIASSIDKRLKDNLVGYVGLSCIDKSNTLKRKQFWKYMIKKFSLFGDTITSFQDPKLVGEFVHLGIATKLGYKVEYDPLFDDIEAIEMSSGSEQLPQDIDRDLWTLNFSIRQELQISGALIWKSINALNKVYFDVSGIPTDVLIEYPFFTLYFASQGIERIQKTIVQLICKKDHVQESEKNSVYDLLTSHAHDRLNDWIEKNESIKFNTNCRKLIDILTRFYRTARYARYADESYLRSITPENNLLLELKSSNTSDLSREIKNNFGNFLGQLVWTYFQLFEKLCFELNIYAYELEYNSAACIVYYGHKERPINLYKEFLKRQNAKKEVIYWLMKKSEDYPKFFIAEDDALDFDPEIVEYYLWELIYNSEDGQDCYSEVDCLYDDLYSSNKEKWKKRLKMMDYLINDSLFF